MKADVEEQKNDAKLGEQVNRSSSRKKIGAHSGHDHAEKEVTNDRVHFYHARQDSGRDAQGQYKPVPERWLLRSPPALPLLAAETPSKCLPARDAVPLHTVAVEP